MLKLTFAMSSVSRPWQLPCASVQSLPQVPTATAPYYHPQLPSILNELFTRFPPADRFSFIPHIVYQHDPSLLSPPVIITSIVLLRFRVIFIHV